MYREQWILRVIYNFNNIPICLSTICYEIVEIMVRYPIIFHNSIEALLCNHLLFDVFALLITNGNSHQPLEVWVINVTRAIFVHSFICLILSNINYEFYKSPSSCICITRSTTLPRSSVNILKSTLYLVLHLEIRWNESIFMKIFIARRRLILPTPLLL